MAGTSISVDEIAALTHGQSEAEILEDHPDITPEQVAAAVDYEAAHPNRGRPFPQRSFKRALSDVAISGVWNVETDLEPVTPRRIP